MIKKQLSNPVKMGLLATLALVLVLTYQFINVHPQIFDFTMKIRTPKTIGMILCAFCIGFGSIIFQSIIRNRIVTPCLLGMNSLYILIHTTIGFAVGVNSKLFANQNYSFAIDVVLMGILGTAIYGTLFKKTKYNILYVLLAGTVLASFFTSLSNTMMRLMDPNQYDVMLTTLVAGFDHINSSLLIASTVLIALVLLYFRKDLQMLDVITLGKDQAINLGVDYDRTIKRLLIATTFFITIATALVGPISFLGLIIANLARELFKTYRHSYLLVGCFLMGVIILLGGQTVIEHWLGFGVQISVLINLFGGVYFLYLVLRNKGDT